MNRRPFRNPRATATPTADSLTAALADLAAARAQADALRRLVAAREEGASALSTAEWRLHLALRRVEALGGLRGAEGSESPLDAA